MWTAENRGNYERSAARYPSDVTDEEWALIEPHLPPERNRSQRDPLCADDRLPMAPTAERLAAQEHGARLLRRMAVRRHAATHPSRALYAGPRACRQRGQPDHNDRRQPERERRRKRGARIDPVGYDAAKKIKGKKRHAAVDTLGLMLGVAITPASVQDRDQIAPLLKEVRRLFPFLERAIADSGYRGATTAAAVKKSARLPLEIVKRSDTAMGFVVLPKRWIVERTFGWLGRCRRLAKDFENLARSHLAFVQLAMIRLMMRRIARLRAAS